jgi:sec-independent protein translocase protein TatA
LIRRYGRHRLSTMLQPTVPLAFIGGLGFTEILMIVGVLVLLFGAQKIPKLARSMGQGVTEFKAGLRGEGLEEDEKAKIAPPEEDAPGGQ